MTVIKVTEFVTWTSTAYGILHYEKYYKNTFNHMSYLYNFLSFYPPFILSWVKYGLYA